MELEQFTWDSFLAKRAAEIRQKKKEKVDEMLLSENCFAYIENLLTGERGWTLYKPEEYWLEWLHKVNQVD